MDFDLWTVFFDLCGCQQINLVPLCFSCKPDLVTSFPALHLSVVSGEASTAQVALSVQNIGNQPSCSAAVELNLTTAGLVFSAVDEEQWLCSARGLSVLRCQPTAKNRHYGAIGPGGTVSVVVGGEVQCELLNAVRDWLLVF